MFAALIKASGQLKHIAWVEIWCGLHTVKYRPSLCQGSRFIDNQCVDLAKVFDGTGISEQHTHTGGFTRRNHDRHGRCQTQCTGASDDKYGDSVDQAEDPAGFRAEQSPA